MRAGRRRTGSGRRRRAAVRRPSVTMRSTWAPIGRGGVRAAPRTDGRDVGTNAAAHRAAVAGDHDAVAATRPLKSSISSSQTAEVAAQALPERRRPARLEHVDGRALLLDPRVVAEVEDAVPVPLGAVDHVRRCRRRRGGGRRPRPPRRRRSRPASALQGLGPLAAVERAAVGGDGDDGVVGAEAEQLRRLDRRPARCDRREPEVRRARRGARRRRRGAWRGRCDPGRC